ncbi:hypothetical protein D3C72_1721170 [compost metagenome]
MLLFVARQRAARVDDDGRERHALLLGHLLQQLVAAHVGQVQVHDDAVERRLAQQRQRIRGGGRRRDLDVVARQQLAHAFALAVIVFDHQHMPHMAGELGFQALQCVDQFFALDRFQRIAGRATAHGLARIVGH